MAVLEIVQFPHEALTTPAQPVTVFDDELRTFIDDMAETMYTAKGVGLAANQVAALRRVTVIDPAGPDDPSELLELVNPEIIEREGKLVWEEGCLSFPELYEKVQRSATVTVRYQDRNGDVKEVSAEGLLAVALQHEIDHLDGILYIDRIKPFARSLALKRFQRILARKSAEQKSGS